MDRFIHTNINGQSGEARSVSAAPHHAAGKGQILPSPPLYNKEMFLVTVEDLIKAGFSYEELYKKGILKAPAEPSADPPEAPPAEPSADPPEAPPAEPSADPPEAPPAEDPIIKALREEIVGLKTAIQNINIKQAERGGGGASDPKPMSVDEAILGLIKEM